MDQFNSTLGASRDSAQLNSLVGFMNSLPPYDTDFSGVVSHLLKEPDRFFSQTSILLTPLEAVGENALFSVAAEALATVGANVFLTPFGMNASTKVRTIKYRIVYEPNVHMWGLSYSTVLGDANVAAELTYRENTPVLSADVARTPQRAKLWNLHLNTLMVFEPKSWGPINLWDFSSMVIEVIIWNIPGKMSYKPDDIDNPDRLAVQNSAQGIGASMFWSLEYQNVFTGWDVMVPIYMMWGIEGSQFNAGYRDGQFTAATGVTFKHLSGIEIGAGVLVFTGDKDDVFQMLTQDRDNVTVHFKYGF